MNITFTNKQEYLQYRKEWKETYKQLSNDIRESKWMRNISQRAYSDGYNQTYEYNRVVKYVESTLLENKRYIELYNKHIGKFIWYRLIPDIKKMSLKAKNMLDELKLAKIEANRQYHANNTIDITTVV